MTSVAAYMNTLQNGFVYDDAIQVLGNPWIKDISNFPHIFLSNVGAYRTEGWVSNYYRPLMHIIYMINYSIFSFKPWGFHLTNIIFHAGVSILVFIVTNTLISKEIKAFNSRRSIRGATALLPAFVAAILFAVHPVHTEVVAWVAGIPELSFSFFLLLAFYLYIDEDTIWGKKYIFSVLAYFVAILGKETAITLPILIFAYDFHFKKERSVAISIQMKRYMPYIIVTAIYFAMRTYALGGFAPKRSESPLSDYVYFINIFPFFASYLGKLVFPLNLNVFHVFHPIQSLLEWKGVVGLFVTSTFITTIFLPKHVGRLGAFGLIWIAVTLLPVLYIPVLSENPFAERYLYMPSVGFVFLIATALDSFFTRADQGYRFNVVSIIIGLLLAMNSLFLIWTVKRNFVWKDDYTLWSDTVKQSPEGFIPHINMGIACRSKGQIDDAIEHYRAALKLRPDSARAHISLGIAYLIKREPDNAIEQFSEAIRLSPDSPEGHNNLGAAYQMKGITNKALEHYQTALQQKPDFIQARENIRRIVEGP